MNEAELSIPDVVARVIGEATTNRKALLGGALVAYGDDFALVMPDGRVFLIRIQPARLTVAADSN